MGRNGQLGVVYEIYSVNDLDRTAQKVLSSEVKEADTEVAGGGTLLYKVECKRESSSLTLFRTIVSGHEHRLQVSDIKKITDSKPRKQVSQALQNQFLVFYQSLELQKEKRLALQKWPEVFKGAKKQIGKPEDVEMEWKGFVSKLQR